MEDLGSAIVGIVLFIIAVGAIVWYGPGLVVDGIVGIAKRFRRPPTNGRPIGS